MPIVVALAALMVVPAGVGLALSHATGPGTANAPVRPALASPPAGSRLASLPSEVQSRLSSAGSLPSLPSNDLLSGPLASGGSPTAPTTGLASFWTNPPAGFSSNPAAAVLERTAGLIANGSIPISSAYLPNPQLFTDPLAHPSDVVSPTYEVSPAPMGLADFGLGPTGAGYRVATSGVEGSLTLSGYNASAGPLYEDTAASWNGLAPNTMVTPWQSGIQLNTVVTNVSYPGSNHGVFWTQNVVDISGSTIQFIDNVWNFTNSAASLQAGTLYSYNGTPVYPEFYYDLGPTVPLSFPVSISLYNNVSNVLNRTTVSFSYRIVEGASVYQGTYDTVVFNSTPTGAVPLLTPQYVVDGSTFNPVGLLYDAELVFGGPGGGSNAVVNSLDGTMDLAYAHGAGYVPASSAYSYGADTGETAIGVAGTWTGTTESVIQGPSILYGLWGTLGGAPSGTISVSAPMTPSYALVFIGPNGTSNFNLSWAPTDASGMVTTALPPLASGYNVTVFADGFDQANGSFGPSTTLSPMTLTADPGVWNAPIYMNGLPQASELGIDAAGWSGSGPILLRDLTVDVNLTFNHVNSFGYPEFGLLWSNGVASPSLVVDNVTQGPDFFGLTLYLAEYPCTCYVDLPGLGGEFQVWGGNADTFTNLTVYGYLPFGLPVPIGGAVALWNTPSVQVENLTSLNYSMGVWAASSDDLRVSNATAFDGAAAVSLLASSYAVVTNVSAWFGSAAVFAEGGGTNTLTWLNATYESVGLFANETNSSDVMHVNATFLSYGVGLFNSTGDTVSDVQANYESTGLFGLLDNYTALLGSSARNSSVAGEFVGANNTTVLSVYVNSSGGIGLFGSNDSEVDGLVVVNGSEGMLIEGSGWTNVTDVLVNGSLGIGIYENVAPIQVVSLNVSNNSLGVDTELTNNVTVSDVVVTDYAFGSVGVGFFASEYVAVVDVLAVGNSVGVAAYLTYGVSLVSVTALYGAEGVDLEDSERATVLGVTAEEGSLGFLGYALNNFTISSVVAADDSLGVGLESVAFGWISGTTVANYSGGVFAFSGSDLFVADTSASNESAAVGFDWVNNSTVNATSVTNWSIGVSLFGTFNVHVLGVTASDPYPTGPWETAYLWGAPTAAVVTFSTTRTTIASVVTTDYPAALFDTFSSGMAVDGLNASMGEYAIVLNGTFGGIFVDVTATSNVVGLQMNEDARYNVVTMSSFVNNTGYGVDIEYGYDNLVYNNDFVGNNGAGTTYDATHLQAFGGNPSNRFNDSAGTGNYWADWHTYSNGVLAPYYVSNGAWDYHPLGAPEGTFLVTFTAVGLSPGTSWSVTLNGVTQSSVDQAITFAEPPGSYAFSVNVGAGWQAAPAAGGVVVTSGPVDLRVAFVQLDTLTIEESGLPAGTSWSAVVNGVRETTTGPTLDFTVSAGGSYAYQVLPVAGYTVSPARGSVTVGSSTYLLATTFSVVSYPVTFSEQGLAAGTAWSVTVDGTLYTSSGTSLTVYLPNGTFTYLYDNVSGYTLGTTAGSVKVQGAGAGVTAGYAPVNVPSYVVTSTFNQDWAIALGLAAVALVVGVVALLLRRGRPPAPATGSGGSAARVSSGTSSSPAPWSEGPGPDARK